MMGISLKNGIPLVASLLSSITMPPITAVSPSFTIISVDASFLLMLGVPDALRKEPIEFLLALIFILTLPSGVICGVTMSSSVASINDVCVQEEDVVSNGTESP